MTDQLSYEEIQQALSLQPPLQMIDAACPVPSARSITAWKQLSLNEPCFQGHFPGRPILPGVLQVAAMEQASRLLWRQLYPELPDTELVRLKRIRFRLPLLPGDTMRLSGTAGEREADGSLSFSWKILTETGETATTGILTLRPASHRRSAEKTTAISWQDFPAENAFLTGTELQKLLPQQPPFLMLDGAAIHPSPDGPHFGFRNITGTDPWISASSPASYPASLMIESAAQLGCAALLSRKESQGKLGLFLSVDSAEFHLIPRPGDRLRLRMNLITTGSMGQGTVDYLLQDQPAATAVIKFALMDSSLSPNGTL